MLSRIPSELLHPSAERILAQVCGYGAPRLWQQRIMVLQAYIDDSHKDGVLVMAGYIADAASWARFSIEWQNRLNEAGLVEFKMSERVHSAPEINAYFYRVIEDHIHAAICIAVPIEPLERAVKKLKMPLEFANPYIFASKGIINFCAQHQEEAGITDPIDFIFDEQNNISSGVIAAWELYLNAVSPEVRALTGSVPSFKPSHQVLPLQAADIIAYWYRHRWNKLGSLHQEDNDDLPFPWESKRRYPRLLIWWAEDDYVTELLGYRKLFEALLKPKIEVTFSLDKWFDRGR